MTATELTRSYTTETGVLVRCFQYDLYCDMNSIKLRFSWGQQDRRNPLPLLEVKLDGTGHLNVYKINDYLECMRVAQLEFMNIMAIHKEHIRTKLSALWQAEINKQIAQERRKIDEKRAREPPVGQPRLGKKKQRKAK